MELSLVIILALTLDWWLGETPRFHPLVGFGNVATRLQLRLNRAGLTSLQKRTYGALAWLVMVLPLPVLCYLFFQGQGYWWLDVLGMYFVLGHKSLNQHAMQVYTPLERRELASARAFCGYLVSRDTRELSEQAVSRAVTESVLENGHDAVLASLFWFALGGLPLAVAHRLANTLDAMWGYKTPKFKDFGWFSARADDWFGWPSAKVTSLLYAMQSKHCLLCLINGFRQGRQYKSLNGGWVMATGATALGIKLGGKAVYFGSEHNAVTLGQGREVDKRDIVASCGLVFRATGLFVVLYSLLLMIGKYAC